MSDAAIHSRAAPSLRQVLLRPFALPFALLERVGGLTPLVTMFVAYPILALDQAGVELQNPSSKDRLGHLPLDEISQTIAKNVEGLVDHQARRRSVIGVDS